MGRSCKGVICLVTASVLIPVVGRTLAQEAVYELHPRSLLGHVHVDEAGNQHPDHADIRGTFSVVLFQSSGGVVLRIRNIDFKSVAGPEYRLSGGGTYVLEAHPATASGLPGFQDAVLIVDIDGFKDIGLDVNDFQIGSTFPAFCVGLEQFIQVGSDPPRDLFGLYVCAAPTGEEAVRFFPRGDADGGGRIDITDPIQILSFLFIGGEAPPCLEAADVNDDGQLDLADPVFPLANLFMGQGMIPVPSPLCGIDPTEDELDCGGQPACRVAPCPSGCPCPTGCARE